MQPVSAGNTLMVKLVCKPRRLLYSFYLWSCGTVHNIQVVQRQIRYTTDCLIIDGKITHLFLGQPNNFYHCHDIDATLKQSKNRKHNNNNYHISNGILIILIILNHISNILVIITEKEEGGRGRRRDSN